MKYLNIVYINWLKFLKIFGNVQMFILLTLTFITFVPILWIFVRVFSDPLKLKNKAKIWGDIEKEEYDFNYFKLQG